MKQTIQNLCKGILGEDWERRWILCLELSNLDSCVYFSLMSSMPWLPQIQWFHTMGTSFFTVSMVMSLAVALLVPFLKVSRGCNKVLTGLHSFPGLLSALFSGFCGCGYLLVVAGLRPTSCLLSALGGHSLPFRRDLSKVLSQHGSLLFQGQQ